MNIRIVLLLWCALLLLTLSSNKTDDDCLVLLPEISGEYYGDCRKGKAHGVGKAIGEDVYEGEFRKGFPHGTGIYKWSNGNYFEGKWKNGVIDGEGKLHIIQIDQPDSIITGFWKEGEYIGKFLNQYAIHSKSSNINNIRITKQGITPNQVRVSVVRKSQKVNFSNLKISSKSGNYYSDQFSITSFPVDLNIEFDSSSATGFGAANEKFNCNVTISENGNWVITIDLSNV